MSKINNKNIIITGGLGLIGKQISKLLAQDGANVIILDLASIKKFNSLKIFNNLKYKLFYIKCDVTNKNDIKKAYKKINKKYKKIDVLINAAAVNDAVEKKPNPKLSMFENYSLNSWNNSLKGNLTSIFLCSQIFGTSMKKFKKGSIINIASTYGVVAPDQSLYMNKNSKNVFYKNPVYPTTKGGIISFTKYLAAYWGKIGIRVNSISPGGIENNQNKFFISKYSSKTLLGRMGKPDDLYGTIKLLCSEESSYITGTNIMIDGGWTAI
tara:strand:+ start:4736 stop:5539 length:804 start_codon:yes stop_codon:yes gene_type:complete